MYNHQKLEIFKMLLYREMDEKKKSGSSIYSMKESNELSKCEKDMDEPQINISN